MPGGRAGRIDVAGFHIGRTAVLHREYASFLAAGRAPAPPWWEDPDFLAADQPVVGVTWDEAVAFGEWLSEVAGGRWRLPSEAEWEHAMSGGLASPATPWGETIPNGEIPEGVLRGPWNAGRGTPNGFGVLDPGTIVHEWCLDLHEPDPVRAASDQMPRRRASRGGSWRHAVRWSAPSARSSLPPTFRYSDYGFRVLKENP